RGCENSWVRFLRCLEAPLRRPRTLSVAAGADTPDDLIMSRMNCASLPKRTDLSPYFLPVGSTKRRKARSVAAQKPNAQQSGWPGAATRIRKPERYKVGR